MAKIYIFSEKNKKPNLSMRLDFLKNGIDVDTSQNRKHGKVGMTYEEENEKEESLPVEESNLNLKELKKYDGIKFNSFKYFGDCISTVYKDHIWDTQEMSDWIYNNCKIIDTKEVIDKIDNGYRKLPLKLKKSIEKLKKEGKIDDKSEIVCALDDYQKIMFVYVTALDIHFFFDCKK